jgi:hypothetical protein
VVGTNLKWKETSVQVASTGIWLHISLALLIRFGNCGLIGAVPDQDAAFFLHDAHEFLLGEDGAVLLGNVDNAIAADIHDTAEIIHITGDLPALFAPRVFRQTAFFTTAIDNFPAGNILRVHDPASPG